MTIAAGVRTMILNIARRVTLAADDPIICQRASAARHVVRRGDAGLPRSADGRRWAYRSLVRDGTGAGLRPGGPAGLGILARDAHVPQRRPVLSATPSLEGGPRRCAGAGRRPDRHGAIFAEFVVWLPGGRCGEGQHDPNGLFLAGPRFAYLRFTACPLVDPAVALRH